MSAPPTVIAFDADDTLWHDLPKYLHVEERFVGLLAPYEEEATVRARLDEVEIQNLERFGYGPKGFLLSLIETAIDLSDGRIGGGEIRELLRWSEALLDGEVELVEGAERAVRALAEEHELLLVTKGDLFDQEAKLASSGLADAFAHVEIVSRKDEATYRRILARHGVAPNRLVMVGNSMRSDVLPVLALGGRAVHVPHAESWHHEEAHEALPEGRALRLPSLEALLETEVRSWLKKQ